MTALLPLTTTFLSHRGFISSKLLHWFRNRTTHIATDTIIQNRRGYPKDLMNLTKVVPQGSYQWCLDEVNKMVACVWNNKNLVYFLSTTYGVISEAVTLITTERFQRTCVRDTITTPAMAYWYNVWKASVDQFDRYCLNTTFSIERLARAHRW